MGEVAEGIKDAAEKVEKAVGELNKALPESRRNVWVSNAVPNGSLRAFLDRGGTHAYNETKRLELDLVAYRNAIENLSGFCERMTAENQELLSKINGLGDSVKRLEADVATHKVTNAANLGTIEALQQRNDRQANSITKLRNALMFLGVTTGQIGEIEIFDKTASDLFPNAVSVLTDARLNPPKSRRKTR